ncbi:MAG: helicase HerA-like domain-containing protein, partial [Candidatus Diapherotrites archaeon]
EGQLTIIDTSFLDDNVTALVIGILARRILSARKIATRQEAAKRFESSEEMLEIEIPPTWLILDEAHTLIPSGNIKTAASDALIEYVKQGRRPGCSLVFATQQPSAIDVRVLSQLDIIIVHKLVFNDDIKAVYKRTPAIIPHRYKTGSFIRTLPVGVALVCDRREETSRGFVMTVRPRMSQHEGREIETAELKVSLSNEQVLTLITSMYWSRLKRDGQVKIAEMFRTLNSLNAKYSSSVDKKTLLAELEKKGATIAESKGLVFLEDKIQKIQKKPEEVAKPQMPEVKPTIEPQQVQEVPIAEVQKPIPKASAVELLSFPVNMSREAVEAKIRKKISGFFGFGSKEKIVELNLKHIPIYKVEFNYFTKEQNFRQSFLFVNSLSGEFIHFLNDSFVQSNGLKELYGLSAEEIFVLNFLTQPLTAFQISRRSFLDEDKIKKILKKLCDVGLAEIYNKEGLILYRTAKDFDLPSSPLHPLHQSIQQVPLVNSEVLMKEQEKYTKNEVQDLLQKIWRRMVVTNIKEIYWPVYECIIENTKTGLKRRLFVDAFTGRIVKPF